MPNFTDRDPCVQWRIPMDMMRQGYATRLSQASQQWSAMADQRA